MADISNVNTSEIKDLYERLEGLSCMYASLFHVQNANISVARIMTRVLY